MFDYTNYTLFDIFAFDYEIIKINCRLKKKKSDNRWLNYKIMCIIVLQASMEYNDLLHDKSLSTPI